MAKEQRVALVTGAAGGIGKAAAACLAGQGMTVVMCDLSAAVEQAAAALAAKGMPAVAEVGDVSREDWVMAMAERVLARQGRIDVLVNNAGISPKPGGKKHTALQMPLAEWQQVLGVNLTGPFLLCRALVPGMVARGWGRVINISSQAGRVRADFAGSHYAATKAGIVGFSRVLAGELGGSGVTVNCIAPGRIRTPMGEVGGAAAMEPYIKATPAGRMGEPEDIANAIAFLASDASGFITGTTLDVNGGFSMN